MNSQETNTMAPQVPAQETEIVLVHELPFERAPGYVDTYAHVTRFVLSPYDMKLVFCEIDNPSKGKRVLLDKVAVTLTLEHVKRIYNLMGSQIARLEELIDMNAVKPPIPTEEPEK